MNNERLSAVLHHASCEWRSRPDKVPDEERGFAGMVTYGTDSRMYTITVCELRGIPVTLEEGKPDASDDVL